MAGGESPTRAGGVIEQVRAAGYNLPSPPSFGIEARFAIPAARRPEPRIIHRRSTVVQIKIAARHGHLSDAAQQMIREKAEKLLHFFERLTLIEVAVDLHDDRKTVEMRALAEHKHEFVAHETNGELQVSVDAAIDKVSHQIRRYKEKIQDHRRTPHAGDVEAVQARNGGGPA